MTEDDAIEFVVTTMKELRPEWDVAKIRAMVHLVRPTIGTNPQRFIDLFLDTVTDLRTRGVIVR